MKITFGLHLDGQRSWRRQNRLGHATVGPLGFISLLETFLGLPKPMASEGERILQYRELLSTLDTPSRFYSRSFQADQYAVARTLLGWRDKWHLYGWDGHFEVDAPHRLCDMADIEQISLSTLTPGIGERLKAIRNVLNQRKHPIESVELTDPIGDFPPRWQEVLQKLPVTQRDVFAPLPDTSNLTRLQQALLTPSTKHIPWANDDSIIVVRSHSRLATAGLMSGLSNRNPSESLLVAEAEGAVYDTLSSAYGNARLGISEKSELRPPLQLLSHAFALAWKPLDVYALLEFLAHPMSPLPRFASAMLAEAVASQPGMGGEKWQSAMTKILEHAGNKTDSTMETIGQWLQPPSIPAGEAAPVELLEDITTRVAKSFRSRLGNDDYFAQRAQHSGNAQCLQIARSLALLKQQGVTTISRLELDQLFEQTGGSGEGSAASRAEVGGCLLATHPSAAIEQQDYVLWWNLAAPSLPLSYPWHKREMIALRVAGVMLPDMTEVMEIEARNWLRPIMAAKKQLVLALPPEGEEAHPIWLSIERVFEKDNIPIKSVEDVLENKLDIVETTVVQHYSLPVYRRWWHLGKGMIPTRKKHSFSSLDKFINNPFEWVLRYPAQINPPRILSVSGGNMLLGSIAHRAVELLHSEDRCMQWSPEQAAKWMDSRLPQLLEEEGAVLLLPGQRASLEAFRHKLLPAVSELHRQLQLAGVTLVEPEKELSGSFFMGELYGYIDILATRNDGQTSVLDMKWARGKAFREKLQDNKHLQLAIYGELMRQKTGNWAVPAYFILAEGNLYAQDKTFFPDAMVAKSKQDGGSALLWQQAQETLRWRHSQIENGNVELVMDGTEPDDLSTTPDGALSVEDPSIWKGDYDHLAGWRADA